MPDQIAPEVRFRRIREILLRVSSRSDAGPETLALCAEFDALADDVLNYSGKISELKEEIDRLKGPPLLHAIMIGPGPQGRETYVVSVNGQRFDVELARSETGSDLRTQLAAGQEVLLRRDTQAIVGIVGPGRRGESAEVRDVLRDPETSEPDRLVVKAGASDGIVVDMAQGLRGLPEEAEDPLGRRPKAGDLVLIDVGAKVAFERLPVHETAVLELETDPDARYEDIAGLDEKVGLIRDAIELPYLHRRQFEEYGLERPRGILLFGPPGCGKTMIGKAVANGLKESIAKQIQDFIDRVRECQELPRPERRARWGEIRRDAPRGIEVDADNLEVAIRRLEALKKDLRSYFLNIKGPELLSKWVGEAEHRIRQIFSEAKRSASYTTPVVVFFDEIESMFQRRGTGISSDLEKTMVPQLLSELDGVQSLENVVVIGASNRHELLDPALLRPGRLDIKVRIDRPDRDAAAAILLKYLPVSKMSGDGVTADTSSVFDAEMSGVLKGLMSGGAYLGVDGQRASAPAAVPLDGVLTDDLVLEVATQLREECSAGGGEAGLGCRVDFSRIADAIGRVCEDHRQELVRAGRIPALSGRLGVLLRLEAAETAVRESLMPRLPLPVVVSPGGLGQERLCREMADFAVEVLFSANSYLRARIMSACGREHTFLLREFVSGALLANMAARAKRLAIKRHAERLEPHGITADDLLAGIRGEFEENKDQFVANKPEIGEMVCEVCRRRHVSADEYEIRVVLGRAARDPWHLARRRPQERGRGSGGRP